ncbi:hypothetical protein HanHA300_Chr09g0321581 [Helianthus annuus]|nr:hypothetical protein HanHA300_Chr09g0321581 [Helianthus annuus]KAJ0542688.1 hypothetical protein HanHA89_Chr09g0342531 [Helianthus annuus]KAJ0707748.1 hypothetical protein HanLR1_Chr09g0321861 [Helianthus annuus]KAJ0711727.1 hypothetical protein HanOQP8_Chr09g0327011 [Helianthus annuus]
MSPLLKYPIQQLLHQKPDIQLQHQSINQSNGCTYAEHDYESFISISPVLQDYKRDQVS